MPYEIELSDLVTLMWGINARALKTRFALPTSRWTGNLSKSVDPNHRPMTCVRIARCDGLNHTRDLVTLMWGINIGVG